MLAGVLAHEGTHFLQYLDLSSFQADKTIIDIEFVAWWNEAAYWESARSGFGPPFDSPLKRDEESAYQVALQGENALRNYITPLYSRG